MTLAVMAARPGHRQPAKFAALEGLDRPIDGEMRGPIHAHAGGHQLAEGARADSTDHDGVDLFTGEGGERLAHAMRMVLVLVHQGPARAGIGVDDHMKKGAEPTGYAAAAAALGGRTM